MSSADQPPVSLVGLPERQYRGRHPGGLRYEGFRHHVPASLVPAPQATRFYSFKGGWRIDALIDAYTRPEWSVGAALLEASAALHMLTHRGRVYHAVRGESDLCFLPRVARRTGNYLVASFHEEPQTIAYYLDGRRIAEQLHGAILLGEPQRSYLERHLPPERIFVVHHSVDTGFFRPAENDPTEPLCITVGAHMRDATTLAAAMKEVWRVNPRVRLVAVGT
jgi:glycosyltransferase involved in cell wall biosynthesis